MDFWKTFHAHLCTFDLSSWFVWHLNRFESSHIWIDFQPARGSSLHPYEAFHEPYSRFSNVCFSTVPVWPVQLEENTGFSKHDLVSCALLLYVKWWVSVSIVIRLINSYRGCLWLFWAWEKQRFHSIALLSFIAAGLFPPQCFHGGSDVRSGGRYVNEVLTSYLCLSLLPFEAHNQRLL